MSNVRLLRQQVDAYQRALEGLNREYKSDYNTYKDGINAYNAQVDAGNQRGAITWVKSADGGYRAYTGQGNTMLERSAGSASVALLDSLPNTGKASYGVMNARTALVRNSSGGVDMYSTRGEDYGGWKKVQSNSGLIGDAPVAPKEPEAPNAPRFTEKEKGLLMNPTAGPAEMVAANARGEAVTSSLAGDEEAGKNSAFANPDDPNNLKDRGVLARVLGGQL